MCQTIARKMVTQLIRRSSALGISMCCPRKALAAALSLTTLLCAGFAKAADMAVKAVAPVPDQPFFLVNDNRVTFSWIFSGTDPGMFSVRPDGTINATTP